MVIVAIATTAAPEKPQAQALSSQGSTDEGTRTSICPQRCVHPSPGRREPLARQHRDCQQDTRVAKKPGGPSGSSFLGRWLTLGHLLAGGHVARIF